VQPFELAAQPVAFRNAQSLRLLEQRERRLGFADVGNAGRWLAMPFG
jgi:hypothetical protein